MKVLFGKRRTKKDGTPSKLIDLDPVHVLHEDPK